MIEDVSQRRGGGEQGGKTLKTKRHKPRREVPDVASVGCVIKVNVDLSETMLSELDQVAILLNVSRQSVIKNFIKDGLDKHFLGQRARFYNGERPS